MSACKIFATIFLHLVSPFNYPHSFLKKRWGYCNRLCPSVRPKPMDEIQPNLVCDAHMNGMCNGTFFGPAPWGPGEGPKGQI